MVEFFNVSLCTLLTCWLLHVSNNHAESILLLHGTLQMYVYKFTDLFSYLYKEHLICN